MEDFTKSTQLNKIVFTDNSTDIYGLCCCCLVVKLCPTLRDPTDQSTPGPPVFHCLPELSQIHLGSFDDTVQPSHPLLSPSPLAFTLS